MLAGLCTVVAINVCASAAEVRIGSIRVYPPEEVLGFCQERGGVTYIHFPGARRWKMEGGQDTYHAMSVEDVVDALRAIEFPVEAIDMHILVLPVPRSDQPNSSAEGNVVFLSPGRVPYQTEHIHYTVTHEIGHVVHYLFMPDSRYDLWRAYADLRGVDYSAGLADADHAYRLHEIFAEDFRVLFGGDIARFGGRVENHEITPPEEVEGLDEFFLSLLDGWTGGVRLYAYPNPFETTVILRGIGFDEGIDFGAVSVSDVAGRMIRLLGTRDAQGHEVVWDGRNGQGQPVGPGVYLITARTDDGLHTWKVAKVAR